MLYLHRTAYYLLLIYIKEMGYSFMKKTMGNWRLGMWKAITSLAMVITVVSVNSACMFEYYQPKMPKGSEKLRRD